MFIFFKYEQKQKFDLGPSFWNLVDFDGMTQNLFEIKKKN